MPIPLELQRDIERGLAAQATARGLSLSNFVKEIVAREPRVPPELPPRRTGQDLIDASARVRGLLTDEEIDTDGQIAATALERGITVVTRNVKDFASLGVIILNPFLSAR
jgi:hypothetical protein